jgi:hypothetical protein
MSSDKKYSSGGVWNQGKGAYVTPGQSDADYAGWADWVQKSGGWGAHGWDQPGTNDQGPGLTGYLGKAVRLATNPVNAGMDILTGGKTQGKFDPFGYALNKGVSNVVGTDIDAALAGTGQYAPQTYGTQGAPAAKTASPNPTATTAGGANLTGAGGAKAGTTTGTSAVDRARGIADAAGKQGTAYADMFEDRARDTLGSGLFGPDKERRDAIYGKGTEYEGGPATDYYLGREMDGLRDKSYSEKWFTGEGPDSLASVYDREGRKQNIAMQNRLSAMGKGNSGAAIRGGAELDAELSAKKALQMQGAAKDADASQMARQKQIADNATAITTGRSFFSSNLGDATKDDRSAAERALEIEAAIPKGRAAAVTSSLTELGAPNDYVVDAEKDRISTLGTAGDRLAKTAAGGLDINTAEGKAAAEQEANAYFMSLGVDANQAAQMVKTAMASAGGIGPLMELIAKQKSGNSNIDTTQAIGPDDVF